MPLVTLKPAISLPRPLHLPALPAAAAAPVLPIPPVVFPSTQMLNITALTFTALSLTALVLMTLNIVWNLRDEESQQEKTGRHFGYSYQVCDENILKSFDAPFGEVTQSESPLDLSWHIVRHCVANVALYSIIRIGSIGANYVTNKCAAGGLPQLLCTGIKKTLYRVSVLIPVIGIYYLAEVASRIRDSHQAPFPESYCFIDGTLRAWTPWMQ